MPPCSWANQASKWHQSVVFQYFTGIGRPFRGYRVSRGCGVERYLGFRYTSGVTVCQGPCESKTIVVDRHHPCPNACRVCGQRNAERDDPCSLCTATRRRRSPALKAKSGKMYPSHPRLMVEALMPSVLVHGQ